MKDVRVSIHAEERVWDPQRFPTFRELVLEAERVAAASGGAASWSTFGTSRSGNPLGLLTVGDGTQDVVVLAGVHPNEPVGGLTALRLAERLVTDERLRQSLDLTWHIAVCVDPDGLRLNEGWFAEPGSREAYEKHCFRPAPDEQVEWAFPLTVGDYSFDRPLPETLAMMRLLDEHLPALVVTLHNAELGGAYFWLTAPRPELYGRLADISHDNGIELSRDSPEDPLATVLAPGVLLDVHPAAIRTRMGPDQDFATEWGTGCSALHYAERFGAFGLIPEVSLWTSPLVGDERPAAFGSVEACARAGNALVARGEVIVEALKAAEPYLLLDDAVTRAARRFAPVVGQQGRDLLRAAATEPDKVLSVGQLATVDNKVHQHSIRYGSLLLRAFDRELAEQPRAAPLSLVANGLREEIAMWRAAFGQEAEWRPVPIRQLVTVQLEAVLAVARTVS